MKWKRDTFIELCRKALWDSGNFDRASVLREGYSIGYSSALFYHHWDKALKMGIIIPVGGKLYKLNESIYVALPPVKKIESSTEFIKFVDLVMNHLNRTTGRKYRATAAVIRHISARHKEGYKYNDFEAVINKKTKEWKGTKMEKYLRPLTLFGTKFDSYLNQVEGQLRAERLGEYEFEKYFI